MTGYHRLGLIPSKRHTQFRRPDGTLYTEELFGTNGFFGRSSVLYHHHLPPAALAIRKVADLHPIAWQPESYRHHHLRSRDIQPAGDFITGRCILLFNADVALSVVRPNQDMDYFYRSQADELIFVHEGQGTIESVFGNLDFRPGDYIVVPRGTTYRARLDQQAARLLVVESSGSIETPKRYRNEFGQLLEHAPYCERDIRIPTILQTHDERGEFEIRVKVDHQLTAFVSDHHPFDVVGWDGYLYPWALNIADHEPITGRIHQPPPVHQTFQGPHFVVCSFVPRKLDYHPQAIPIPYHHSNIDFDEVLYYVTGSFGSRRGVEVASLTLHPRGIPHGPQPGLVEHALGKDHTDEMAVMIDTSRPLALTKAAQALDDSTYPYSWRS